MSLGSMDSSPLRKAWLAEGQQGASGGWPTGWGCCGDEDEIRDSELRT